MLVEQSLCKESNFPIAQEGERSRAALQSPVTKYLRVAGREEYKEGCSFIGAVR